VTGAVEPDKSQKAQAVEDDPQDITFFSFRPTVENEWETKGNRILNRHPYICGYLGLTAMIVIIFATNLTTFAISLLFLYLISDFMTNDIRRFAPFLPKALLFSLLYLAVIALIIVLSYKVIPNFVRQVPDLVNQLQRQAVSAFEDADARWSLTDYVNMQDVQDNIVSAITKAVKVVAGKLTEIYKGVIYFIFALVINLVFYHNPRKIEVLFTRRPNSLMTFLFTFALVRVRIFYYYFKKVMGGQIIISIVNTMISSIIIVGLDMPHRVLLMLTVFFCGLFPIVGNLVSNTLLTLTALISIGPWAAIICLGLLVGIHKLEYFLNSKIIGEIVHLPMVVMLTCLIVSEVLLGILGLMLAIPVMLFIRHEFEHIPGIMPDHPYHPKDTVIK